jgi:hypothetical protein
MLACHPPPPACLSSKVKNPDRGKKSPLLESTAEVTDAWAVTRTMAKPLCSLHIRLKDEPADKG